MFHGYNAFDLHIRFRYFSQVFNWISSRDAYRQFLRRLNLRIPDQAAYHDALWALVMFVRDTPAIGKHELIST